MKKFLLFIVISFLFSGSAYAGRDIQKEIDFFNKWLYENDYHQYLDKESNNVRFKLDRSVCNDNTLAEDNNIIKKCVGADGSIIPNSDLKFKKIYPNNLDLIFYDRFWIPEENPKPKPNYGTFVFELYRYLNYHETDSAVVGKYLVKRSDDPYTFQSNLIEDKYIDKQLNKSGLLSYLYFENGEIKIDKISPKNRFGKFIDDDTKFRSMSVGKSMVSYVVGHAICEGYIESIDSKVNDWPLVENTLYHNQKLIDLLNFRAGDQKYTWDYFFVNPKTFKNNEGRNIETLLNFEFQNSKKSKAKFNYSSFLANLLLNYVVFKTDENFEELLEKIFKEKVKIENEVFFSKVGGFKLQGNADNMFYATRYDYLRIAKAMLDDWQNDTCVGKYLKTIFERKEKKGNQRKPNNFPYARSYAGMFQTNYESIPKKRPVMGMHGYGGQHIVIDFENSRIVVANSIHENWDWRKIIYSKIRKSID